MDWAHGWRARAAAVTAVITAAGVMAVGPFIDGARATTCDTWTAGTTGSWTTAGDWSDGVPSSTDDACLPASTTAYTVTLTSSQAVGTITTGSGATLVLQANSTNDAAVLTVNGDSDNAGEIDLIDTDTTGNGNGVGLDVASGTLTNDGTIASQAGRPGQVGHLGQDQVCAWVLLQCVADQPARGADPVPV